MSSGINWDWRNPVHVEKEGCNGQCLIYRGWEWASGQKSYPTFGHAYGFRENVDPAKVDALIRAEPDFFMGLTIVRWKTVEDQVHRAIIAMAENPERFAHDPQDLAFHVSGMNEFANELMLRPEFQALFPGKHDFERLLLGPTRLPVNL